jgi:hypothetical protein
MPPTLLDNRSIITPARHAGMVAEVQEVVRHNPEAQSEEGAEPLIKILTKIPLINSRIITINPADHLIPEEVVEEIGNGINKTVSIRRRRGLKWLRGLDPPIIHQFTSLI